MPLHPPGVLKGLPEGLAVRSRRRAFAAAVAAIRSPARPEPQAADLAPAAGPVDVVVAGVEVERLEPRGAAREVEELDLVHAAAEHAQDEERLAPVVVERVRVVARAGVGDGPARLLRGGDGSRRGPRVRQGSGQ